MRRREVGRLLVADLDEAEAIRPVSNGLHDAVDAAAERSGTVSTPDAISVSIRISAPFLAASPGLAQEATDDAAAEVVTTTEEGGSDWGWIGLLGLIGPAGLSGRRRDNVTITTR